MSTKFAQPKNDNWVTIDGWVFPDMKDKQFNRDPNDPRRWEVENYAIINSFENQQGIFGQYRHFYGLKLNNNYLKSCFAMCINPETLSTSNLTQSDKVCARECLISAEKYTNATNIFIEKIMYSEKPLSTIEQLANI